MLSLVLLLALASAEAEASGEVDSLARASEPFSSGLYGLPTVFFSPETSLAFGAALMWAFQTSDDNDPARPSQLTFSGAITLRKQATARVLTDLYFAGARVHVRSLNRFSSYPDTFFGVGNDNPADAGEGFTSLIFQTRDEVELRLVPDLYMGLLVDLEYDDVTQAKEGGLLASGKVSGSAGGGVTGLGLVLTYQDRDQVFYPRRGGFYQVSGTLFDPAFGGDYAFFRLEVDLRHFVEVAPGHVLAFQAYSRFAWGDPPFQYMSMLGGPNLLRGYYQGRFRDRHGLVAQVEYRADIWWRLGGVVFAGVGQVAERVGDFAFDRFKPSGGVGLRWFLDPDKRISVRVDAGVGLDSWGLYLDALEAF